MIRSILALLLIFMQDPRTVFHSQNKTTGGGGGTFTISQHVADRRVWGNKLSCSGTSCTLTVPSTGTGHGMMAHAFSNGGNTVTAISGGGTWTVPAACQFGTGPVGNVSCGYVTNSSSGATSISFTFNGTVTSDDISIFYWEYAWSGSSISFDACWLQNNTTTSTTIIGPTLTLAGGTEVVAEMASASGGTVSAAASPYDTNFVNTNDASANLGANAGSTVLNNPPNTASSWTVSPTATSLVPACALKGN